MVVYKPNKYTEEGKFTLWKHMLLDVKDSYELGIRLFLRDFFSRYKQSLLGVLWLFILPIFGAGVFIVLNKAGILSVENTSIPYPVYALYGTTIWSLFSGILASFTLSIKGNGSFMTKINFPRIALVYSPILISLVDFTIRLLLLLFVAFIFGVKFFSVEVFLLSVLPLIFFSIGIGFFLSLIGGVVGDTSQFISIGLNVLIFFTPVMYPISGNGWLAAANRINPLNYFISVPRDILFHGKSENLIGYYIFAVFALFVFLAGWRFYQVAVTRITEKI